MQLELQNPLPLLSANLCGIGFDIAIGKLYDETAKDDKLQLTLCLNFFFGQYLKSWEI